MQSISLFLLSKLILEKLTPVHSFLDVVPWCEANSASCIWLVEWGYDVSNSHQLHNDLFLIISELCQMSTYFVTVPSSSFICVVKMSWKYEDDHMMLFYGVVWFLVKDHLQSWDWKQGRSYVGARNSLGNFF